MPAVVDYWLGRVEPIANSGQMQRIKLREGEDLTSRLVVGASGVALGSRGDHRAEDRRRLTIALSPGANSPHPVASQMAGFRCHWALRCRSQCERVALADIR